MAAITSNNVTTLWIYEVASKQAKTQYNLAKLAITLATQGATANDIPASALGFASIEYVIPVSYIDTATSAIHSAAVGVSADGLSLYPADPAALNVPLNLAGVLTVVVAGRTPAAT
jgi:hypothetical protein